MTTVGIIGNGPPYLVPKLKDYHAIIDIWIGADAGALLLLKQNMKIDFAVGDFDSLNQKEKQQLKQKVKVMHEFPEKKDYTDMELALEKAYELHPESIYLFGVTGGRLDHELINIQLLYQIEEQNIRGFIIDNSNEIMLPLAKEFRVQPSSMYPYISFVPITPTVKGLTLKGFYYSLHKKDLTFGSTLCISNKLVANSGNVSYEEGILLLIKSRDVKTNTIPT